MERRPGCDPGKARLTEGEAWIRNHILAVDTQLLPCVPKTR